MATTRDLEQELEVKIDTKEQRNRNFPNAKNWTKFNVKIEAIQCFPCYVKVTLVRNNCGGGTAPNPLIVRITIPGLHVQIAASRTKPFCYGLFWKSNRKRCSIFLAFSSDQERNLHMCWIKDAIKELERYRQDFLDIRRASRCSTEIVHDQQVRFTDVFSNYQNLGPLPVVPVTETDLPDYSRRQSTASGIYEEIADLVRRTEVEAPKNGEGIYERLLRPRSNTITKSLLAQTPPPLPPRPRINTMDRADNGLVSLATSPDSDTLKKRKYKTVLESIFGKQSNSRKGSESSTDDGNDAREKFNMDFLAQLHSNIGKNKRHSMSTPELANWDEGEKIPSSGCQEVDEVDVSEWQDVSCMSLLSESFDISSELNISDKIKPNYNLSMNASTINLVGCNFNAMRESEVGLRDRETEKRRSLNQVNGYCVMKPIQSQSPSEEGVDLLLNESEKSSGYCPMGPLGFDRGHVKNLDQKPVRGIIFNEDRVNMLQMKNVTLTRGIGDEEATEAKKRFEDEESFLRRKTKPGMGQNTEGKEDLYENCRERGISRSSKYLVEDKIPSYLPNDSPPHPQPNQLTPPKLVPKQRSRSSMTPSPRMQHCSPRAVPNIYSVPRNNSPVLMDNARDTEMLKQSLTDSISKLSLSNSPVLPQGSPGGVGARRGETDHDEPYANCKASLQKGPGRQTPDKNQFEPIQSPKYLDKCTLKAEFANLKKFASLPRFRKLDLSPLRLKLNNVLHRHNSEF